MSSGKIVIYSEKSFCATPQTQVTMLAPFWAEVKEDPHYPGIKIFDNYFSIAFSLFHLTDNPQKAEVAVLPDDWKRYCRNNTQDKARDFCAIASKHGLKTLVFFHSDSDEKIPLDNVLIFRTSLNKNQRNNEYALPAWTGDLYKFYQVNPILIRSKSPKPKFGFCGNAYYKKPNLSSILVSFIFRLWKLKLNQSFPSAKFRHEILRKLKRENDKGLIETYFIIRDKYMAGYHHHKDLGLLMENRKEYYENLIHSDLSVCMRGGGNFSNRFYEALSLGRIPLFINTVCQLPYENWIDYSKHTLWVEHNEMDNVGKIIQSFWRTLDEDTYRNIQLRNRKLWEDYLSPEGFFSKLPEFLLETNTIS